METAVILEILGIALKNAPAFIEGLQALGKDEVSMEDLRELGSSFKDPSDWS